MSLSITTLNNMQSNKYSCLICNKTYTRKNSLDKHKILCDFKTKSKRERSIETEELGDLPNQYELIKIVQELSLKMSKMEEKIEEMQKWIDKKKKKINVVSWLNSNINPTLGFKEWVTTLIEVNQQDFVNLMENSLYYTLQHIFEKNLPGESDIIYPIQCFTQKNCVFYICEKNENSIPEWRPMVLNDMILILKNIQNNIIKQLSIWKSINQEKFNGSDKVSDIFNKAIIKLMSISFTQDASLTRIKNGLYNYLKTDLKIHMDYDFEF